MNKVTHILPEASTVGFEANGRQFPSNISVDDWRSGVEFIQASCNPAKGWENVCNVDPVDDKFFCEPSIVRFDPFPIYHGEFCSGNDIVDQNMLDRGRQMVLASRSSVMAQEAATGMLSGSPSFRTVGVPLSDDVFDLKSGIAQLLKARVRSGVGGKHKIHIPAMFAPQAQELQLVSNSLYDLVFDFYDDLILPDSLLPNGDPATAVGENEGWITATGIYEYAYSPLKYKSVDGVDAKRNNLRAVRWEQQAIFRFDVCNVFMVKVRLVGC